MGQDISLTSGSSHRYFFRSAEKHFEVCKLKWFNCTFVITNRLSWWIISSLCVFTKLKKNKSTKLCPTLYVYSSSLWNQFEQSAWTSMVLMTQSEVWTIKFVIIRTLLLKLHVPIVAQSYNRLLLGTQMAQALD